MNLLLLYFVIVGTLLMSFVFVYKTYYILLVYVMVLRK